MERRKFLVGVGGSAIGGGALLGSGAFTRIQSQRRVKIEVAEDPDAYLGLDGCPDSMNSSYTRLDGSGHLEIEMSDDNVTEGGGQGVNSDSFTYFDNLFQICNQGKQTVGIWIEATPRDPASELKGDEDYGEYSDEDRVIFYNTDDPDTRVDSMGDAFELGVGDCKCIGMRVMTKGLSEGDQLLEGDEIVIHADADVEEFPPVECDRTVSDGESIQAAIDAAGPGETICVEEGTYQEDLSVDVQDLTLRGANAGIPGQNNPRGGEATIVGTVNVGANEDGVTIDGFRIEGKTNLRGNNVQFRNNVIRREEGDGVDTQSAAPPRTNSFTIAYNDIRVGNFALRLDGDSQTQSLDVLNNNLEDSGRGIQTFGSLHDGLIANDGGEISGNSVVGNSADGIRLAGGGFNVSNNTIEDNENGIRAGAGGVSLEDLEITDNDIKDNRENGIQLPAGDNVGDAFANENNIVGNDTWGVLNQTGVQFDATNNWWGDEDGPGGEGPGDGDAVSVDVDFSNWATNPF